jgi:SAM-dependent methyltransferase
LPTERAAACAAFLDRYRTVRLCEGWGATCAEYYRSLPFVAEGDPQQAVWRMRARHYQKLLGVIAAELAKEPGRVGLRILDAGAGNCWLTHRLARAGHMVSALDISDDPRDGLGARVNYAVPFDCYQSEYDRLPFAPGQFDLVIFNASLHYTAALANTLGEAARLIVDSGQIVVLDSPFYLGPADGQAMLAAREARFAHDLGLPPQVWGLGFLTSAGLEAAAARAGLQVNVLDPDNGWRRRVGRGLAHVRTGRAQASFPLLALQKAATYARRR